ncbi:hypothetical protein MPSEU_000783100 [Mayamaea pseudoterrestris]|nr:hypothetical protein MPSEU_000783100 [Mayamaea pseudoterrestris]
MVSLPFTHHRNPRTVVNGRLVEPQRRSLSLQRLAVVSLCLAFLYYTNYNSLSLSRRRRATKNFAFWSLTEVSSDRVRIQAARLSYDCLVRKNPVCAYIRDQLAHGKPILYDENDYPYTVHRTICWSLFFLSLLQWCWDGTKLNRFSRNMFLDAALDLLLLPLDSVLSLIGLLSFVLYPTWMRMQTMVLLQHQSSLFHESFAFSVACLLLISVLGNALSRYFFNASHSCQLGRLAPAPAHALIAAAAGYYRGTFASDILFAGATPSHTLYGTHYYSPMTMNWMLVSFVVASVILARRRGYGIGIIVSWILVNIMAAMMGRYQQEQQLLPVLAGSVSNAWSEFLQSLVQNQDYF